MTTPTTSTLPAVKAALVTALDAALPTAQVTYAWEGLGTKTETIFLDPFIDPQTPDQHAGRSQIATLKAGRKAREETYTIVVVIQVVQAGGKSTTAAATEARAYVLYAGLEDVLANDPGLAAIVGPTGRFTIADHTRSLSPIDKGWVSRLEVQVDCAVRLS